MNTDYEQVLNKKTEITQVLVDLLEISLLFRYQL